LEKLEGGDYFGDTGIDEMILRWIFSKQNMKTRNGFKWLRIGLSGENM
jgi:hypothetical protein